VLTVLVVAGVRMYREGLAQHLGSRATLHVTGTAANRDEALALVRSTRPDVVVLDMATRDNLAIVRAIADVSAGSRIVAFGVEESERDVFACADAGVAGYVPCEGSIDDLVATIESVTRDELLCSPRMAASLFRRAASAPAPRPPGVALTAREREVVGLLAQGLSNKEIARRLHIEVATVKNHVHNLLEKLHVPTRAEAAALLRPTGSFRI
jgi:DNA-binding NarL/FixJ family response regulator